MNYRRVYEQLIADRRTREGSLEKGTFDRHHVDPRCLGGSDEPENLIRLSRGDHLFAHVLLAKIHGGRLVTTAIRMAGMAKYNGGRSLRRRYQALREAHGRAVSLRHKGKTVSAETRAKKSAAHKGKPLSEAHRKALGVSRKGKPQGPMSDWIKKRISDSKIGKNTGPRSQSTKDKQSAALKGRVPTPITPEIRAKMSEAQKLRWIKRKSQQHA